MKYPKPKKKEKQKHDWKSMCEGLQKRDGAVCARCGYEFTDGVQPMNAHHVKPRSRGGSDDISNMKILCAWPRIDRERFGGSYPGCHSWVHQNVREARSMELLK